MVYDRNSREGTRADQFDYERDYGSGRDYSYSSAREYEAAGRLGPDRGRGGAGEGRGYYGADRGYEGRGGDDRQSYGARDYGYDRYRQRDQHQERPYHGAYAAGGRPFEDVGRNRHADDDDRQQAQRGGYGRAPQGHRYEDRGFLDRAGDEVRSWFGDDDAERRREQDQRHGERSDRTRQGHRDEDYHSWRSEQIAALDRDYDEYRQENRSRFHNEFSTWRTGRQGQRDQLNKVSEHQEVLGSDGQHVGTVDKVKDDRILLTKNDKDAGGQHHSIPSSWIASVDDKVTLNRSADDAKQAWRDEDRTSAMFGYGDNAKGGRDESQDQTQNRGLNRSFSGTY